MVRSVPAVVCIPLHTGSALQVLPCLAALRGHLQQLRHGFQRLRQQRLAQMGQDVQY